MNLHRYLSENDSTALMMRSWISSPGHSRLTFCNYQKKYDTGRSKIQIRFIFKFVHSSISPEHNKIYYFFPLEIIIFDWDV
jgi:hypothetical protein